MINIAVASDLHYDSEKILTPPENVARLARTIQHFSPDAVVLAGDIGHPLHNFKACLDLFADWEIPVGVVAGNHDVWRDVAYGSQQLWEEVLPRMTRIRNCRWLELEEIRLGDVAIVGSIAWYDYSALEPSLRLTSSYLERLKKKVSNDATWIDWPWRDRVFARMVREGLVRRLERLEEDSEVQRIVVITHVPLFEEQLVRDPANLTLSVASAFFGNLRTGKEVARFPKVVAVVSGHLHRNRQAVVPRKGMAPIVTQVVGSDYGEPNWVVLQL